MQTTNPTSSSRLATRAAAAVLLVFVTTILTLSPLATAADSSSVPHQLLQQPKQHHAQRQTQFQFIDDDEDKVEDNAATATATATTTTNAANAKANANGVAPSPNAAADATEEAAEAEGTNDDAASATGERSFLGRPIIMSTKFATTTATAANDATNSSSNSTSSVAYPLSRTGMIIVGAVMSGLVGVVVVGCTLFLIYTSMHEEEEMLKANSGIDPRTLGSLDNNTDNLVTTKVDEENVGDDEDGRSSLEQQL